MPCRAQGLDPKAAAAAIEKPPFSSLRDKFKAAIQKYDVVIMSFEDALVREGGAGRCGLLRLGC